MSHLTRRNFLRAAGGAAMASIRTWVFVNLCIGILIICVTLLMG